jgi:pyruvate,water dikinase
MHKAINAREIFKIQKGDILVCPMTDPDYVVGMQKAAAIVTDHGGILCHAAIVSRAFKKPCVIGTQHATRCFSDGDMVTVDADNGTVSKLGYNP